MNMSYVAKELSGGALLRDDTGEWVKSQARKVLLAIEPLCADVARISEGDRSDDAIAWRNLLASIRDVLPVAEDSKRL